PIDTALALQGLTRSAPLADQELNQTLSCLLAAQQADGGWGPNPYISMVGSTAEVVMALHPFRELNGVQAGIDRGKAWLLARQNSDGGFGNDVSTVHDTSLALLALKMTGVALEICTQAVDYLLAGQSQAGSWQGNVFLTALAVTALNAGQVAPDLAIFADQLLLSPEIIEQVPGEVTLTVPVHNLSTTPLAAVKVDLFQEEVIATPLDSAVVDVDGQETIWVTLTATLADPGLSRLIVVADPLNVIDESDEQNNRAERLLPVEIQPPVAGFELPSSSWPEGVGTIELAVSLNYPWHEALQVGYALDRTTSSVDDHDHQLVDGSLSIPAGETMAWLTIPLIDDQQVEADETLVVFLTGISDESGRHELLIQDDEPPLVTILSPLPGFTAENNPQLLFTSTVSNNLVMIDGQPSTAQAGDLLGPFADGVHQLRVVAVNSLGLNGVDQVDFHVDTSLPQITIRSPAANSLVGSQPLLDCEVSGAVSVEYRLDGQVAVLAAGERFGPLADGGHRLQVLAVNLAGSLATEEVLFTVDSRPPLVEIGYPVNGYLRDVAPRLQYTVDETALVTVWIDDSRHPDDLLPSLGPLADGLHRVRVDATDGAGNLGSSQVEFVVATGVAQPYGMAPGWPVVPEGEYGGMAVDASGSVYLALRSEPREFSLVKYAADGTLLWKSTNSSFFNLMGALWVDGEPKDLAVDSHGNLFVVGWGWLNERYYGFLAKYDSQGRYLSHRLYDTGRLYGDAKAYALVVDDQDRVYVGGNTEYDCIMKSGLSATIFVARYDNNLNLETYRILGDPWAAGSFHFSDPEAMEVAPDGRLLMAGTTGGGQMLLWAFDAELSVVQNLATGMTGTYGADVVADRQGRIYLVGRGSSGAGYVLKVDSAGSGLFQTSDPLPASPLVSAYSQVDGTLLVLDSGGGLHRLDADLNLLWSEHLNGLIDSKLAGHPRGWLVAAGSYGISSMAAAGHLVSPLTPGLSFSEPVFHASKPQVLLRGLVDPLAAVELASESFEMGSVDIDPETGHWQMLIDGLKVGTNLVEVAAVGVGGLRQRYQCEVIVDQQPPQVRILAPGNGSHHL
ncbi:MAG: hypothetical protein C0614_08700, partial [Desulfuromonas sp.]